MIVKCHRVNNTVTYYCTIMKVLSHCHEDMIVIELSHVVLAVSKSVCRRTCVLKAFRRVFFIILLMTASTVKIIEISVAFTEVI